jgi:hypothetical protein
MRHQSTGGGGQKNRQKKVADGAATGSQKNDPAPDELTDDEIDPADFFDPEEFGHSPTRSWISWTMSSDLVPIPRREIARAGLENLPPVIARAGEAAVDPSA